ncbi:MAG: GatB/YqeY domain-containing protein [Vicinamibacterales bacterium]
MSFIDDIGRAITDAMRSKDVVRLSTLRMLKAALMNREVEKKRALDDAESRQVVHALVKQRRDSIEQFVNGGRQELADKEAAEITVLESYLPAAADRATLERAVREAIAETGATSPKDMGGVMKATLARLAGQTVDGKVVSELVRTTLASR